MSSEPCNCEQSLDLTAALAALLLVVTGEPGQAPVVSAAAAAASSVLDKWQSGARAAALSGVATSVTISVRVNGEEVCGHCAGKAR